MRLDDRRGLAVSARPDCGADLGVADDDAFRRLVEPHRASLLAHCYRMLGSLADADDALQETMMRAWRALDAFEGRSTPRTWLHRIATNVCLDSLARRRRRVLPIDYGSPSEPRDPGTRLDESVWVEPYPDVALGVTEGRYAPEARYEAREAVELAFVAAMQHLPSRQRAVLILRDVLGFSAREVAEALGGSVASVNSLLQRARRSTGQRLPDRSQQATLRSLGDARVKALVDRLIDAFERGEVSAIVGLLTDDVTFQMPPYTGWCRGREAIAESWLMPEGLPHRLRYLFRSANGQPGLGTYALDPATGEYVAVALDVLTVSDGRIGSVTAFRTLDVFPRFDLPDRLVS